VFVGISWTEYARLATTHALPPGAYTAQGAVLSVASGRISYHFALKGPSIALGEELPPRIAAASPHNKPCVLQVVCKRRRLVRRVLATRRGRFAECDPRNACLQTPLARRHWWPLTMAAGTWRGQAGVQLLAAST
jgi:hypothetical protein